MNAVVFGSLNDPAEMIKQRRRIEATQYITGIWFHEGGIRCGADSLTDTPSWVGEKERFTWELYKDNGCGTIYCFDVF